MKEHIEVQMGSDITLSGSGFWTNGLLALFTKSFITASVSAQLVELSLV